MDIIKMSYFTWVDNILSQGYPKEKWSIKESSPVTCFCLFFLQQNPTSTRSFSHVRFLKPAPWKIITMNLNSSTTYSRELCDGVNDTTDVFALWCCEYFLSRGLSQRDKCVLDQVTLWHQNFEGLGTKYVFFFYPLRTISDFPSYWKYSIFFDQIMPCE